MIVVRALADVGLLQNAVVRDGYVCRADDPEYPEGTDGPVFEGQWRDNEWHKLVPQNYQRELTGDEVERYARGPRKHPFEPECFGAIIDGRVAYFRNKESYQRWMKETGRCATTT